jgi:hypothetical protein
MKNLLSETIECLHKNGKQSEQVLWCGAVNYGWFTWEDFTKLADENYDSGLGAAAVVQDLLVVGEDFWLERHEYDGSEWWEYKAMPQKPAENKIPKVIVSDELMWKRLAENNRD